ncbi:unnamed protein product [Prunus armeniaca]
MDDSELGYVGFDPYEFANVIGDGVQPLYPGCRVSYEKIHACPNNCILYRNDYEDSTHCPTCGRQRFNLERGRGSEGGVVFSSNSKV